MGKKGRLGRTETHHHVWKWKERGLLEWPVEEEEMVMVMVMERRRGVVDGESDG